ncbi:HMA2 domain-containing protein, partial [Kitasatospora sp. MY 5-36]|uniref:HMA2 domain-containing protein n=1 Tax=Kitasatospora sp. MY 5-36 TaxID=1678027 RepID=UPI000A574107
MPSLLGAAAGFRSVDPDVSPRSVIPGRQRWDVKLVLGRPRTAEVLTAALRRVPGITEAQANPVTGGVLVRHEPRLPAADVGRILRRVVARVAAGPVRTAPP